MWCVLLCTSKAVRGEMRGWVLSAEGDKWTVKLDVRDSGGHLDTTSRGGLPLCPLGSVLLFLVLILFLPFLLTYGRIRVVRAMFHGVEVASCYYACSLVS